MVRRHETENDNNTNENPLELNRPAPLAVPTGTSAGLLSVRKFTSSRKELQRLKGRLSSYITFQQEQDEFNESTKDLDSNERNRLSTLLKQTREDLEKLHRSHNETITQFRESEMKLNEATQILSELRAEIQKLNEKLKDLDTLEENRLKLDETQKRLDEEEAKVKKLEEDRKEEIDNLVTEFRDEETKWESSLREQKDSHQQDIKTISDQHAAEIKKILDQHAAEIQGLKDDLDKMKKPFDSLHSENEEKKILISSLTEANATLSDEKNSLTTEKNKIMDHNNMLLKENQVLLEEKNGLMETNQKLNRQILHLENSKRKLDQYIKRYKIIVDEAEVVEERRHKRPRTENQDDNLTQAYDGDVEGQGPT